MASLLSSRDSRVCHGGAPGFWQFQSQLDRAKSGTAPRDAWSFCHIKRLHSNNPSFSKEIENKNRIDDLYPIGHLALPARAEQCVPRGQCAMKWWKGPDCACHHHGKEIKPYPTGIDGGPPTR